MKWPSVGLLGRIVLILTFVLGTEFIANTLIFERASQFAMQDDEAHRMAENLAVARRVLDRTPETERAAVARELSSGRLHVRWSKGADTQASSYRLHDLRAQIVALEPKLDEAELRLNLMPLRNGGDIGGSLELTDHSSMIFRATHQEGFWPLTLGRVAALALPMLALALMGGMMIRATLRPLRVLMAATSKVGQHEPVLVQEKGPSEIRDLIRDFNVMHLRIHRLLTTRTQALAAVGHDLRTPLARMELRLESSRVDGELRDAMMSDISEMEGLLHSLQIYLGDEGRTMPVEKIDLAVMASTIIDAARDAGEDAHFEGPPHMEVWARTVSIRRAIANLVENALKYGGNVRLAIRQDDAATLISVEDDGPGIPTDKMESVLLPFVRLDEGRARSTSGMGLGLAIVDNAIREDGGTLLLENRPEGGLRATIRLPHAST